MWSWLYLQLLNLVVFIYLFIYLLPVSDISRSVQLSLRAIYRTLRQRYV